MWRNKDIVLLAPEKSTAPQLSLTIYVLLRLVKEAESMIRKRRGSVCVCGLLLRLLLLSLHSSHGGDRVPLIAKQHSPQTKACAPTAARIQYR